MENNMENKLEPVSEGLSAGERMAGVAFAVVLIVILNRMGFGMIIAGAICGGLGMGLGMLVVRAIRPKNDVTNE